jgi:3-hydroxybutyryl-CoA dehydratase
MTKAGYYFEDLAIGTAAEFSRVITAADIAAFAEVSGDHNPVHLDEAYAATTPFKGVIAHGIFVASQISALVAEQLPGAGSIYVSQTLSFRRPVRPGDEVVTRVEVVGLEPKRAFVTLSCRCLVGGKAVLEGEAVVLTPRRADT